MLNCDQYSDVTLDSAGDNFNTFAISVLDIRFIDCAIAADFSIQQSGFVSVKFDCTSFMGAKSNVLAGEMIIRIPTRGVSFVDKDRFDGMISSLWLQQSDEYDVWWFRVNKFP